MSIFKITGSKNKWSWVSVNYRNELRWKFPYNKGGYFLTVDFITRDKPIH